MNAELQKINLKFSSDIKIATEQEKRYKNMLQLKSNVFLKKSELIDNNIYNFFRVYNKYTKQTYSVAIEYPAYIQSSRSIYASCDCPDFSQRASKYSIACKHILKCLQSLKNDSYINLTNMIVKKERAKEVKIEYLDLQCPNCKSKAVVPYKTLSCIFNDNKDAKYVCESCYYRF